ncbi:hypothetical protein NGB36_19075 [Streptomyces sp. RB6PN25]|uniref:Secreted protein n=1 Tax=Streptomyces humicola TaxID=2953240 RepID=A0ABT1PY91_9ACTN|nr:hypothetical protein [Streptomyces humicola]MCQ4082650.1 hypothetical protein [Streptomyces humicola]
MQLSAGPDLPHARSRAGHWLATAAALAAAIGAGTFVPHSDASATATVTESSGDVTQGAPDPADARFPLHCGGVPVDVVSQASADLDGDGRLDTVAVVRCDSPTGTPPSGMYVLSPPATPASRPRITGTLLDPGKGLSVKGLEIDGRTVAATLLGYSSDSVPRCCPDLSRGFTWSWRDGRFLTLPDPGAGSV